MDLDHIILGTDNLERGITWLEERTGVRAAFGGVHPGRGTQNALLALGPRCYLEILAPDPGQTSLAWFNELLTLHEPRIIAWAVHTDDLATLAKQATAAGFSIAGPADGSRSRPDGKLLRWRLFHLRDDRGGLLPFFIEWNQDSVHPSTDAPSGCRLTGFHLESPAPQELASACRTLGVEVAVEQGAKPLLCARISSPKGEIKIPR
jgi:catechol 2,3-dioxygenase-like lactoylglutathione lyase family enzyme